MSVRVYPGDHITLAMNFGGNAKAQQEVADRLHAGFPQYVFNIVDVYTMSPTVLWVSAPEPTFDPSRPMANPVLDGTFTETPLADTSGALQEVPAQEAPGD